MRSRSFFEFLVALITVVVFPLTDTTAGTVKKLDLLITSDLHGWLSTSDLYPNRKKSGLLHLRDQILSLKSKYRNLILIDGGDLLVGSPLSFYCHNVGGCKGAANPFFRLFNQLGYDAVVVGNHDLDINPLLEGVYLQQARFSWLSANIFRDGKPLFSPYLKLSRSGLTVVIIGFTTPGVSIWQGAEQLRGMEIWDLQEAAQFWLDYVKKEEHPDVLIGVFHVGLNSFRDDENSKLNRTPIANGLRGLIEKYPDFHLIISGHDHYLNPRYSNRKVRYIRNTPVISGGRWGEAALAAHMELTGTCGNWRLTGIKAEVFHARQEDRVATEYRQIVERDYFEYLQEKLPWSISSGSTREASRCINKLIAISHADTLPDATLFPVVRVSGLSGRRGTALERSDLFRWVKYENRPVTLLMSERDLYLLNHPDPEYGYKRIAYNRKLYFWSKIRNPRWKNSPYLLNQSRFERKLKVAISDYHFRGGGGIIPQTFLDMNDLVSRSETILRDSLFDYLTQYKKLPDECGFLEYKP